jgi:pilus assembly protein Flp/PilA
MEKITTILKARFAKLQERGASAVEYGLLIAGIAAVIVVAVMALGPIVSDAFHDTSHSICDEAADNAGCADLPADAPDAG